MSNKTILNSESLIDISGLGTFWDKCKEYIDKNCIKNGKMTELHLYDESNADQIYTINFGEKQLDGLSESYIMSGNWGDGAKMTTIISRTSDSNNVSGIGCMSHKDSSLIRISVEHENSYANSIDIDNNEISITGKNVTINGKKPLLEGENNSLINEINELKTKIALLEDIISQITTKE